MGWSTVKNILVNINMCSGSLLLCLLLDSDYYTVRFHWFYSAPTNLFIYQSCNLLFLRGNFSCPVIRAHFYLKYTSWKLCLNSIPHSELVIPSLIIIQM
jgi:hypothetical protein